MIYPIAFHMKTTADKINANTDQTKPKIEKSHRLPFAKTNASADEDIAAFPVR